MKRSRTCSDLVNLCRQAEVAESFGMLFIREDWTDSNSEDKVENNRDHPQKKKKKKRFILREVHGSPSRENRRKFESCSETEVEDSPHSLSDLVGGVLL